jgi:hypothetical protein
LNPVVSIDPLHKWPNKEYQGDPSAPGYYPLKPDWYPQNDLAGVNALYAGCDMQLVVEVDPDPFRDRIFTLNYLGALTKDMIEDAKGEPFADFYTLPKGASRFTLKFSLPTIPNELEGKKGALEVVFQGSGRDTSAWMTLYNHPSYTDIFVNHIVDNTGRINLGITGGTPNLMMSINGRPWKNAYSPLTEMEQFSISDGVSIWLREPNGCWEMQFFFRSYAPDPVLQRLIEITPFPGVQTTPAAGSHYVFSHHDFTFTASFADGNPRKVMASGYYSGIRNELIGRKLEEGLYEYVIRSVTEPWTITFSVEPASGETGVSQVEGLSIRAYKNTLYIHSDMNRKIYIYDMKGSLYKCIDVSEGDHYVMLERGIYLVVTGIKRYNILIY